MNKYLRAVLLGTVSGMRSSAAPLAAQWVKHGNPPLANTVAFAGEVVADKMPFVPSRTKLGPLAGRAGAAVYGVRHFNGDVPARSTDVLAALASVAASFAFMNARRLAVERARVPALAAALAEDALCLGLILTLVATS